MPSFEVDQGLLSLNEFAESPAHRFVSSLLAFNPQSPVVASVVADYSVKMADYRKANLSPFKGELLTHFFRRDTRTRGARR